MSKKSCTDTLKKLNPGNISGAIPQALDLIKNLKQITGNPKMFLAVGPQQLLGMFQHLAELFKIDPKKILTDAEKAAQDAQAKLMEKLKTL